MTRTGPQEQTPLSWWTVVAVLVAAAAVGLGVAAVVVDRDVVPPAVQWGRAAQDVCLSHRADVDELAWPATLDDAAAMDAVLDDLADADDRLAEQLAELPGATGDDPAAIIDEIRTRGGRYHNVIGAPGDNAERLTVAAGIADTASTDSVERARRVEADACAARALPAGRRHAGATLDGATMAAACTAAGERFARADSAAASGDLDTAGYLNAVADTIDELVDATTGPAADRGVELLRQRWERNARAVASAARAGDVAAARSANTAWATDAARLDVADCIVTAADGARSVILVAGDVTDVPSGGADTGAVLDADGYTHYLATLIDRHGGVDAVDRFGFDVLNATAGAVPSVTGDVPATAGSVSVSYPTVDPAGLWRFGIATSDIDGHCSFVVVTGVAGGPAAAAVTAGDPTSCTGDTAAKQ